MTLRERALAAMDPPVFGRPRGIVMGAGGHRLLANAFVALRRLRELSDLPVELCHAGPGELPPGFSARLSQDISGVTFRDLGAENQGFHLKPWAVLHSEFREVLWLDADNLALGCPESLFELPDYQRTGAQFWPDLPAARWSQDSLFVDLGLDPRLNRSEREFESGQMVLDRSRCWPALSAAARLSSLELRPQVYGRVLGDKDIFRLAFRLTEQPYSVVTHDPIPFGGNFFILAIPGTDVILKLDHPRGSFYATGLLQHHPDGSALFAHKTVMEWKPHLDFVGMTHVQRAGRVLADPELAALEAWGYRQLRHFRQGYGRFFRPDRGEQLKALLRWLARLIR